MKKLMFTAAVAAMSAGAFAGVAQVYDMTINVKTTECKDGKKLLTDKCGRSYRFYRAQTSYKFDGKFWGCGCPTIAAPIPEQYGRPRLNNGLAASEMTCEDNNNSYMFWGKKLAFHQVNFGWELLQLIGKDNKNIEGVFDAEFFGCLDGEVYTDASFDLRGAGYGTADLTDCTTEDEQYTGLLNSIKSMSGNVVGIYNVADLAGMVGCVYCGDTTECAPFAFCPCIDVIADQSAAFGTFTIKYNSTLANKVMNGKYIDEAYKFPSFVTEEFVCIAEGDDPEPVDPQDERKDKAVKSYNLAKEGVVLATAAAETAAAEAKRLSVKDWMSDFTAVQQTGTAEGIAIYNADTNAYAQATAATVKAIAATGKAEIAFRASYGYVGGSTDDANELIADAMAVIKTNDAYNKAKAEYDEVMAKPESTADQKKEAKENLLKAETNQKAAAKDYEEIMKSSKATIMTATVKTDFANFEKAYKAQVDAANAEVKAAQLPTTTVWLSGWGVADDKIVDGSQYQAFKAAQAASKTADAELTAAKETLRKAELECIASGAECF